MPRRTNGLSNYTSASPPLRIGWRKGGRSFRARAKYGTSSQPCQSALPLIAWHDRRPIQDFAPLRRALVYRLRDTCTCDAPQARCRWAPWMGGPRLPFGRRPWRPVPWGRPKGRRGRSAMLGAIHGGVQGGGAFGSEMGGRIGGNQANSAHLLSLRAARRAAWQSPRQ